MVLKSVLCRPHVIHVSSILLAIVDMKEADESLNRICADDLFHALEMSMMVLEVILIKPKS